MSRRQVEALPEGVEGLAAELRVWREQRRRGQRIPERVWRGAAKAARRHGLHPISQALKLDYYQLKRRVDEAEGRRGGEGQEVFAELTALAAGRGEASCVVELEKGNGAKLRVSVSDAATVDWCRLKEAFLGA